MKRKRCKKMSEGFVDIHSHTLWDIDDGSGSVDESVDLCIIAAETGTEILFLTPHLMYWENAEELFDERNEKCEILNSILDEQGIPVELKTGFEILCDDDIFNIKYFKPYTLCGSRYILIEFDFFKTTSEDVCSWCSYLIDCGLVPVIAHPERYSFMQNDDGCIDVLSDKGVLFQVNAGSLGGMFGERIQVFALRMLEYGFVDFVGSDAHGAAIRNTDMAFCLNEVPSALGELLHKAMCENPLAIINDEALKVNRLKHFAEK